MNKILISALIAGSLMLLDSPEAAADKVARSQHRPPTYHVYDSYDRYSYRPHHYRHSYHGARHSRDRQMPRWLKRNLSFSHWFNHTRFRRDRRLSWNQLFDIYRWEYNYHRYRGH